MAKVSVDDSSLYKRTHSPSRLAWSEGWQPLGAFTRWTGWTLRVIL